MADISKKKILYTNENSIDNNKIKNDKTFNRLNKNSHYLFLKKIEKIISKKGQMTTINKSKGKINNYSVNNSFANFQKKFGNKLYNNLNIKDKTFTTKGNVINKLKDYNINKNKNTDILKTKTNNKNLFIKYKEKKAIYIFTTF